MDNDPQQLLDDLSALSNDLYNGPSESYRLLDSFNRMLSEEQVEPSFIDLCLIGIFDQTKGLLKYITSLHVNKQFKDSVKKAIEIVYTIINNFSYKVVESNVVDIYTMCIKIMKSSVTDANIRGKIIALANITLEKVSDFVGSTKFTEALKELLTVLIMCLNQRHTSSTGN
ncbi:unnamed protein product, partial [Callosobruchus maculatus]